MSAEVTKTLRHLQKVILGATADDDDMIELMEELKKHNLVRASDALKDTTVYMLTRVYNEHAKVRAAVEHLRGLEELPNFLDKMQYSASDKLLGDKDVLLEKGTDAERLMSKMSDYYAGLLSRVAELVRFVVNNADVATCLGHSVLINLDIPSLFYECATDASSIDFYIGSVENIKGVVNKMNRCLDELKEEADVQVVADED